MSNQCNQCGSYAINHHHHGRDGSDPDLCDVCYWHTRHDQLQAELAEVKAELSLALKVPSIAAKWQKDGDHDHVTSLPGELWGETHAERYCKHCGMNKCNHGMIKTLEGGHIVCPGDWIIKGVKGEYYPCKPDIFDMTYTPAQQSAPEPGWDSGYESGYNDAIAQIKSAPAQPLMKRIAELEAELARVHRVKDNYSALNMDAQQELAALKAKAAVPDWMASSSQFAERTYHAGWRDLADAQHEGIAVMYDELIAAAQAQPQSYQDYIHLCAALYQACGAYDMPERVLDALSAAANAQPFIHLVDGILPCMPDHPQSDGVLMPVSDVEEYISLLIDEADAHLHRRHQPEIQAHMRAEIERVRALLGGEA